MRSAIDVPQRVNPGALVSSLEFTVMKPCLSVAMPAAARFKASVLGGRPVATSR